MLDPTQATAINIPIDTLHMTTDSLANCPRKDGQIVDLVLGQIPRFDQELRKDFHLGSILGMLPFDGRPVAPGNFWILACMSTTGVGSQW